MFPHKKEMLHCREKQDSQIKWTEQLVPLLVYVITEAKKQMKNILKVFISGFWVTKFFNINSIFILIFILIIIATNIKSKDFSKFFNYKITFLKTCAWENMIAYSNLMWKTALEMLSTILVPKSCCPLHSKIGMVLEEFT